MRSYLKPLGRRGVLALWAVALFAVHGCATMQTYVDPDYRDTVPEGVYGSNPYLPGASRDAAVAYSVYLVGDLGAGPADDAEATLAALRARAQADGDASAVVLLGDLLASGMPAAASPERDAAQARLQAIGRALEGYPGRVLAVPGDREWQQGPAGVQRMEEALEAALGRGDVLLPGDALSGPGVVTLADGIVLVGLDTGWWMADEPRPTGEAAAFDGARTFFDVDHERDVLDGLHEALSRHEDDLVIVAAHHPLRSNGRTGGYASVGDMLWPPAVGAVGTVVDALGGSSSRLYSRAYRPMARLLEDVLFEGENVVYAAAHNEALEYTPIVGQYLRRVHHVGSGSASKAGPVVAGRGAAFVASRRGFFVIRVLEDGSTWLDAVATDRDAGPTGTVLFHTPIRGMAQGPEALPDVVPLPPSVEQTVEVAPNPDYDARPIWNTLTGRGYRASWAAEAPFPVLDLSTEAGGLTPVRIGGGQQSITLHLNGGDGHAYVLRLLDKRLGRSLPPELRKTIVADAYQEQVAATTPYSAPLAARLAETAGMLHTAPRLVYVPDDPRLGRYRELFANQPALLELRPRRDMSDVPSVGYAGRVVSSDKLSREIRADHDHRVDQPAFLRARLFDLLIGDWDRHADQWRWAAFEPGERDPALQGDDATRGKVYVPIPRDRDMAFNRAGGLLTRLALRANPAHQPFADDFRSVPFVMRNGRPIDRPYLNAMTREDWLATARDLQARLDDRAIADAFEVWPAVIDSLAGDGVRRTLRARRDALHEAAETAYRFYAQTVDVVGSDQRERFVAAWQSDGSLSVTMEALRGDGSVRGPLYHRRFVPDETREVRLYGLRGDDAFVVEGDGRRTIHLRIVGGPGDDAVDVRTDGARVSVYDSRATESAIRGPARTILADAADETVAYDPLNFPEATLGTTSLRSGPGAFHPRVSVGVGGLEGLRLGVGLGYQRVGFRRTLAASHEARLGYATGTGGVTAGYEGVYPGLVAHTVGGFASVQAASPSYAFYFHGYGNEAPRRQVREFYQVERAFASLFAGVDYAVPGRSHLRVGAVGAYADAGRPDVGQLTIASPGGSIPARDFDPQAHAGLRLDFDLTTTDRAVNPLQGVRWHVRASGLAPVAGDARAYGQLDTELSAFVPIRLVPQVTVAARAGVAHRIGSFPFYDAAYLGSRQSRGLVLNRYTGRTSAYQSAELRAKLFNLRSHMFVADVGALAFVDNGRVWADAAVAPGENNAFLQGWHQGVGGGLWMVILNRFVLSGTVAQGGDGLQVDAGAGFFF